MGKGLHAPGATPRRITLPAGAAENGALDGRLAALEAVVREQQEAIENLLKAARARAQGASADASPACSPPPGAGGPAQASSEPGSEAPPEPGAEASPQLRRRGAAAKLSSTSGAGSALQAALQTAKQKVASSKAAAAASAKAARWAPHFVELLLSVRVESCYPRGAATSTSRP